MRHGSRALLLLALLLGGITGCGDATVEPRADLRAAFTAADPTSEVEVDHTPWQRLLDAYLVADHPSGIWRIRYAAFDSVDRDVLTSYLTRLQAVDTRTLHPREQMAFWINLYNARTVALIVERPDIESITTLAASPLSYGPWDQQLMNVNEQTLSLDDVEHGILRPLFKDPRIHFGVNCASLGCPNLLPVAFTRDNLDAQLTAGARAYVNHPRGARFEDGTLVLSSIFDWYADDFGSDRETRLDTIAQWA